MAADNAIVIGMMAASFAPENRKKIIAYGVAAAFLFRILFISISACIWFILISQKTTPNNFLINIFCIKDSLNLNFDRAKYISI